MREICMLRSTRRGLETWHGPDGVTLADERARQRGTQTSTYTGAPVLDPTDPPLGCRKPKRLLVRKERCTFLGPNLRNPFARRAKIDRGALFLLLQ